MDDAMRHAYRQQARGLGVLAAIVLDGADDRQVLEAAVEEVQADTGVSREEAACQVALSMAAGMRVVVHNAAVFKLPAQALFKPVVASEVD